MFNFMDLSCEKQRHYTNIQDQPAGICVMPLTAFRICAATGDIYIYL